MNKVSQVFSVEEKGNLLHDISTEVKDIMTWKCHLILRSSNQLSTIFQTHKSVTQDFAIKFLLKVKKKLRKNGLAREALTGTIRTV